MSQWPNFNMSRTARWEFFLTRWAQLYDVASGAAKAAKDTLVPELSKQEVRPSSRAQLSSRGTSRSQCIRPSLASAVGSSIGHRHPKGGPCKADTTAGAQKHAHEPYWVLGTVPASADSCNPSIPGYPRACQGTSTSAGMAADLIDGFSYSAAACTVDQPNPHYSNLALTSHSP